MDKENRTLTAHAVVFFSRTDEQQFFDWLDKVPAVESYHGKGPDIIISLSDDQIGDDSLRELLALFTRYGVDMPQLAVFETNENRFWFRNPVKYWYRSVFQA